MQRFDKYWIGIVAGILIPALFTAAYVERMGLWNALLHYNMYGMLNKLFLVAVFPNMALFFLLYKAETWKLAKGIIIGAIPYPIIALVINFI